MVWTGGGSERKSVVHEVNGDLHTMDYLMARFLTDQTYDTESSGSASYMMPKVRKVMMEPLQVPVEPAPSFISLLEQDDQTSSGHANISESSTLDTNGEVLHPSVSTATTQPVLSRSAARRRRRRKDRV